jgi:hypothetical protein
MVHCTFCATRCECISAPPTCYRVGARAIKLAAPSDTVAINIRRRCDCNGGGVDEDLHCHRCRIKMPRSFARTSALTIRDRGSDILMCTFRRLTEENRFGLTQVVNVDAVAAADLMRDKSRGRTVSFVHCICLFVSCCGHDSNGAREALPHTARNETTNRGHSIESH